MAERGYFKSLFLRKSIDAVEVCVPLVAGTVDLVVVATLHKVGLLGRFGPSDNVNLVSSSMGVGFFFSFGFFMMSAWALLDATGSSWRSVVDVVRSRHVATRVALEQTLTTSSHPEQIVRTLARRYITLSIAGVFASILSAFGLAFAGRHDLFGIVKSQLARGQHEDPVMYVVAGAFASLALASLCRHVFSRWLEHDLADSRLR